MQCGTPRLLAGQALVDVVAAPINPADVLTLTGEYGQLPPLPAIRGREGVGRVAELGSDTADPLQLSMMTINPLTIHATYDVSENPYPLPHRRFASAEAATQRSSAALRRSVAVVDNDPELRKLARWRARWVGISLPAPPKTRTEIRAGRAHRRSRRASADARRIAVGDSRNAADSAGTPGAEGSLSGV